MFHVRSAHIRSDSWRSFVCASASVDVGMYKHMLKILMRKTGFNTEQFHPSKTEIETENSYN